MLKKVIIVLVLWCSDAFTPSNVGYRKTTWLQAINVLVRKAKEAEIKKLKSSGNIPKEVEEKLKEKKVMDDNEGELQKALTKRKGTITVIAEYKRKLDKGGFIDEILDPDIMSSSFREYGATAMAVMTDERT